MCWLQLTANYQKIAFFNLSERFFTSYTCMRFCGDMITLRECFVVICACNNVWGFLISVTMMRWNLPTPRTNTHSPFCLENSSILWLVLLSIQQEHTIFTYTYICSQRKTMSAVCICCRTEIRNDRKSNQYPHESAEKKSVWGRKIAQSSWSTYIEHIHASHIWWQQI